MPAVLPGSAMPLAGLLGDPIFVATMPDQPQVMVLHAAPEWGVYVVEALDPYTGKASAMLIDDFIPMVDMAGAAEPAMCRASDPSAHLYYKAAAKLAGSYAQLNFCGGAATSAASPAQQTTSAKQSVLEAAAAPAKTLHHMMGLHDDETLSGQLAALEVHTAAASTPAEAEPAVSFGIYSGAQSINEAQLHFTVATAGLVSVSVSTEHMTGRGYSLSICSILENAWNLVGTQQGAQGASEEPNHCRLVVECAPGNYIAFVASESAVGEIDFNLESEAEISDASLVQNSA